MKTDTTQQEFENLLNPCQGALERYVYYKMPSRQDGEDLLQEVYLAAYQKFDMLTDKSRFKAWILSIAVNKCNDFYRRKVKALELPFDEIYHYELMQNRTGITVREVVRDTLDNLPDKDKQVLFLFYIKNMGQKDIATKLNIPVGTVKSRLYKAKQNFKNSYPYPPVQKGEIVMINVPEIMPEVRIHKADRPVFEVQFEELPNWFIIPKLGEKIRWASYDYPAKKLISTCDMTVIGKIQVHGVDGVEILCVENPTGYKRHLSVQLTHTHIRYLSDVHYHGDVKSVTTFLDDDFLSNWGYGEENFGREIQLKSKRLISMDGGIVTSRNKNISDVIGRYTVEVSSKEYNTILLMELNEDGIMTESYIDKNGRTVLWRRFNKDNWALKRYKKLWSEQLPNNGKIIINDDTYVHWYDCISDYIL